MVTVAPCGFSPIEILAGYLGVKLGERLRSRAVPESVTQASCKRPTLYT